MSAPDTASVLTEIAVRVDERIRDGGPYLYLQLEADSKPAVERALLEKEERLLQTINQSGNLVLTEFGPTMRAISQTNEAFSLRMALKSRYATAWALRTRGMHHHRSDVIRSAGIALVQE